MTYDPKHPIPNKQDYGHATALIRTLERYEKIPHNNRIGQAQAAIEQLESSDFQCTRCGKKTKVTRDIWPESTCEDGYSCHYVIIAEETP